MVTIVDQTGIFHFSFPFVVITIGWSWSVQLVSRFFISVSAFLFITQGLITLNIIDLGGNLRIRRSRGGNLGLLGRLCC